MKKFNAFICFLLCITNCLIAQSNEEIGHGPRQPPRFMILANTGEWYGYTTEYDAYELAYRAWNPQAGLGLGCEIDLSQEVAFRAELGLDWLKLKHHYRSSKKYYTSDSDLDLFYLSGFAGFIMRIAKPLSFQVGVAGMASAFTLGRYSLPYSDHQTHLSDTLFYTDDFSRLRRKFTPGLQCSFGFDFPPSPKGRFSLRLTSFVGRGGVFKSTFRAPLNPSIFQLRLGVGYTLPGRKQSAGK